MRGVRGGAVANLSPVARGDGETGIGQKLQVFHDGLARDGGVLGELGRRQPPRDLEESFEESSSRGI